MAKAKSSASPAAPHHHQRSTIQRLRDKVAALECELDLELGNSAVGQEKERDFRIKAVYDGTSSAAPAAATAELPSSARPADMIAELKLYLEAVVEADGTEDPLLASITQQHAISYAVKVVNGYEDGVVPLCKVR